MESKQIEKLSPQWLEQKLTSVIARTSDHLANKTLCQTINLGGLGLFIWYCLDPNRILKLWEQNPLGGWLISMHWPAIATLWFFSLLPASSRWRPLQAVITLLSYLYLLEGTKDTILFLSNVALTFAPILILTFILPVIQSRWKIQLLLLTATVGALTTQAYLWTYHNWGNSIFWTFRVDRFWMVAALYVAYRAVKPTPTEKVMWLSPSHLVFPIPQPLKEKAPDTKNIFLLGAALISIALATGIRSDQDGHWLHIGFQTYLYYYLNMWGALNVVTALARLNGWDVVSPFRFAPLAVNPAQLWRRWNIPFYEWLKLMVFAPIFRIRGHIALAVFATFLCSFFLHHGLSVLARLMNSRHDLDYVIRDQFVFISLHAMSVYIALKWPKLWPASSRRIGWLGVLGTTLIMSAIHWWTRWT